MTQYLATIPDEAGELIRTGTARGNVVYVGLTAQWCTHRAALRAITELGDRLLVFAIIQPITTALALAHRIILDNSARLAAAGVPIAATSDDARTGYTMVQTPQPESADAVIRQQLGLASDVPLKIVRGEFATAAN